MSSSEDQKAILNHVIETHSAVLSLHTQGNNMLAAQATENELLAKILAFLQQPSGSDIRDLIVQILARLDSIDRNITTLGQSDAAILKEVRLIAQRVG